MKPISTFKLAALVLGSVEPRRRGGYARAVDRPGRSLHRGYLAPCTICGDDVVHAHSTGEPFHQHREVHIREAGAKASESPAFRHVARTGKR